MRNLSALAIAALVAAGIAAPASAASFTPTNTFFSASGPVTVTTPQGSFDCTMTANAIVTGGGQVEIMNASFSGSADACFENTFVQNPYYVTAKSTQQGKILNVVGFGDIFSPCGPGALPFTTDGSGVWILKAKALNGGCTISGTMTTSPTVTIVP